VERVRSRGHVNRRLTALQFSDAEGAKPGATVFAADGSEAGQVTSAAFSPLAGKAIGMAYLRREYAQPGRKLQCGAGAVEVITLPLRAATVRQDR
jgi:glycine cleavage system aminomethyltransferase T